MRVASVATVAQLAEFDEIIDVRSPSEFAEDHIPGAVNHPVLDDAERARVGTLYKQVSPFEARKVGAALVARNIARHLEQHFAARPRDWHPLVYCWRGGKRSGAMGLVMNQVGWPASQLAGGYKSYRRMVREALPALPQRFRWRVVCGLTGCGKSCLLQALRATGAQVLDLEALTRHRGSVLGSMPDTPQPSQKLFESLLLAELGKFDPAAPVYVEAESKKIGNLRVPQTLMDAMWQSDCIHLEADQASRVQLLKQEYAHFLVDSGTLQQKLDCLTAFYGKAVVRRWRALADQRQWEQLVEDLLTKHYDPAYTRSTLKHYVRHAEGLLLRAGDWGEQAMRALAHEAITWKS